jgi:hypothetical protein
MGLGINDGLQDSIEIQAPKTERYHEGGQALSYKAEDVSLTAYPTWVAWRTSKIPYPGRSFFECEDSK